MTPRPSASTIDADLVAWAVAENLVLVDWCGATAATEAEGMRARLPS